jgi:hypothetical protein
MISQYFEAFPGHAAKLNQTLDDDLRERWTALAKENRLFVPSESTTRGHWIREAFTAWKRTSGFAHSQSKALTP